MAYFFRYLILCAFFLLPSISVKAAETYPVQGRYVCSNATPTGANRSICDTFIEGDVTGAELAVRWIASVNGATGDYPSFRPWSLGGRTGECRALYSGRTYAMGAASCMQSYTRTDGYTTNYGFSFVFGCPYGGTRSGEYCINAPDTQYGRNPTTGEPNNPPCIAGDLSKQGERLVTSGGCPSSYCIDGCSFARTGLCGVVTVSGERDGTGFVGMGSGGSCTADGSFASTNQNMTDCLASGNSYGEVNGVYMCLKSGTPGAIETETTPETTTKTEPADPSNPAAGTVTTSTTSSTTVSNGVATTTTTTTTTDANGVSTTTTSTTSEPVRSFCEQNPSAPNCGDGNKSFSGTCGNFTCSGDAIQCAMAKKQHQDRCDDEAVLNEKTHAKNLGDKILNGQNDGDVQGFLNGTSNRTVDLGQMLKETGDASFAASGFSDVQVSVLGHVITVPFSRVNMYLEILGYILLACSYLYALRIVGLF